MTGTYFEFFENDPKEEDFIEFIESHPLCVSEKSPDDHEWSPLYHATSAGFNNIVKALLKHNLEVDFKDSHGRTPLWIAASNGEEEIVKVLLQNRASPSVECCTCKTSVLHIAVQKRHLEVVRLLVTENIDIDPEDARGETPLFKAVRNNDLEMVKELVERGASKSIQNDDGKTLEMLVTEAGDGVYVDPRVETEITGRIVRISDVFPFLIICRFITFDVLN
jgi:26S proteasome non-ATPase regulatory subunit 10